jgi:2,3-bisphosphoglycerate-independent phosphoglycerate mutase
MISAVDLLQGIAKASKWKKIAVSNITGNYHTDFAAKGKAAIQALDDGLDFVYIHVEAPDECGHHGELKKKKFGQLNKSINSSFSQFTVS